jgi:RNA polymerase sigma-70 factor (ECF subfamily)
MAGGNDVDDQNSFQEMLTRLRAGDDTAADQIFHRFARRLVGLARRRLTYDLQAKIDPEDVLQSVFRTFFVRQGAGEFEFAGWHDLWNLLAAITVRKCGGKIDYYRAARRETAREVAPPPADDSAALWEPLAREPTPSEAVMLLEITENLLRSLGDRDRQIFESSLQGATPQQISEELGCSERTVERVLERIRKHLEGDNSP